MIACGTTGDGATPLVMPGASPDYTRALVDQLEARVLGTVDGSSGAQIPRPRASDDGLFDVLNDDVPGASEPPD